MEFRAFSVTRNDGDDSSLVFYECGGTKINCVVAGPTQKDNPNAQEACQIKVRVDFMDSLSDEVADNPANYAVLDYFPDVKEALESQCATMHSSA